MRSRPVIAIMVALFCAWFGAAPAHAQVTTATVYGLVTDNTDAALPGAAVTLTNEATGGVLHTTSNDRGEFTLTFVPVGRYTLTVTLAGFGDYEQQGLVLAAGQVTRLSARLGVSGVTETVSVTADAALINRANAQQQGVVSAEQLRELPLANRDWSRTVALNPGVALAGNGGVAINGLPPAAVSLTIDGTNGSSDPELPSVGAYQGFNTINGVSTEAIEQISVTKGIASAEYGGTMAGNINIITRGGSNAWRGSLFWNHQRDDLNASNPFVATTPKTRFNQGGGSFGGPIRRNTLFFFVNYERVRSDREGVVQGDVPTPEFRAQAIAAQPSYRALMDLYPQPNQPYAAGATNGRYISLRPFMRNDDHMTARIDYQMSSSNRLNGRYSQGNPERIDARVVEANSRVWSGTNRSGTLAFTHAASAWVSETRLGINQVSIERTDQAFYTGVPDGRVSGMNLSDGEYFTKVGDSLSIDQVVATTRGRHSMKVGFNMLRQESGRDNLETPIYSYSSVADFLANIPSSARFTFGLAEFKIRASQYGGFVQDDIRLGAKLVLNVGLRYDYFTVPDERDGRLFNRDDPFGTGAIRPADSVYTSDRNNVSPRVGFAYTIDDRTVVRGGVGVFVNPHPLFGGPVELVLNGIDQQFRVTLSRAEAQARGIAYPMSNEEASPLVQGSSALWGNPSIASDFPNPYSTQWTATVERSFGSLYAVDASYVGNRAENMNTVSIINRADRLTGVRPHAGFAEFRFYEATNTSRYHALQVQARRRFSNRVGFGVGYTLGRAMSYGGSDLLLESEPQETGDLAAEYGPSNFDVRHRLIASFLYETPSIGSGALVRGLSGGWQISGVFAALSGGASNVRDSANSYSNQRPDRVDGQDLVLDDWRDTLQYLNRAAFARVPVITASGAQARPGTLSRNAVRGPASYNLDLGVSRNFHFGGNYRFQIRLDAFNALNTRNYGGLETRVENSRFGRLTSVSTRTMQVGARFTF
ncbi:MAG: TonB-dependent receptor [Acidobacteria bacterium]|nr:TonB-dependent receptor [Acidobacteriota bacterium]